MADVRANADAILAHFSDARLPFEPPRAYTHVIDGEDGSRCLGLTRTMTLGKHNR